MGGEIGLSQGAAERVGKSLWGGRDGDGQEFVETRKDCVRPVAQQRILAWGEGRQTKGELASQHPLTATASMSLRLRRIVFRGNEILRRSVVTGKIWSS